MTRSRRNSAGTWPRGKRGRNTKRVLLIEDNPDHARLVRDALAAAGAPVKIHTAETADDGIELAGRHAYRLILIDAFLQNRLVVNHLPSLRAARPGAPVIVLAGSGDEALAADVIKRGATEYLVKNRETLERLPALLKKYLKRKR